MYLNDACKAKLRDEADKRKKHPIKKLNVMTSNSHLWRPNQWERDWNNGIVEFSQSLRSGSNPGESKVLFLFPLKITLP